MKKSQLILFTFITFLSILLVIISMSFFGVEGMRWFSGFNLNDIKAVDSISISTMSFIIVGMGLSISGTAMQGVTRNKLASSYSLGTIATSMLSIILVQYVISTKYVLLNFLLIILFSVGISSSILLLTFSSKVSNSKIIVVGLMVSVFISSITYILKMKYNLTSEIISFLSVDSFNSTWFKFKLACPIIATFSIFLLFLSKKINVFYVDPEKAHTLGINIKKLKFLVSFSTILVATSCVYLIGPITFVGIMIPQMSRIMLGKNATTFKTMLLSITLSIIILLSASMITRRFYADGITINAIVTAIAGPIVIYQIVRGKYD